jgi:hypothetical protein
MKKMLRDCLLTVGVRQDQENHNDTYSQKRSQAYCRVHEGSYLTSFDSGHVADGFQMVTGDSCQYMKRTKKSTSCYITVRYVVCTVTGCGFVGKYQNTFNLENHYVTTRTDHKELVDRLTSTQNIDRQERLGSTTDGRISLSHTFVDPVFTIDKKSHWTSSLSSGLFERIGLCQCPRRMTGMGRRENQEHVATLAGKQLENSMMISSKIPWTRLWKEH